MGKLNDAGHKQNVFFLTNASQTNKNVESKKIDVENCLNFLFVEAEWTKRRKCQNSFLSRSYARIPNNQTNQPRWAVRRSSCEWVAQCFPSCRLLQACFHKCQDMRENILLTPFLPHSSQQKKEFFKQNITFFSYEESRAS